MPSPKRQIYARLQTRDKDGRFVSMGGATPPRRRNARRTPPCSPTSGGDGAKPYKLRARRAHPSSPTDGAKRQKLEARSASPSSLTGGGDGAKRQKLEACGASPSSPTGGGDGAKGLKLEAHRGIFIDVTSSTEEEQEGRKNKGKGNPTTATSNKQEKGTTNSGKEEVPLKMMSFRDLHNNLAASQESVNALADELAKEKERKKALQCALQVQPRRQDITFSG